MAHSFDIVIVGGGVIGSAIAYHAARGGRRVLVVERREPACEPSASWASAGGVRRQGRRAAEAMLACEATARWPQLAAELDADLHYRRGGNLLLGESEEHAVRLARFVARQQALGFDDVRLVEAAELRRLVPELAPSFTVGSWSPADGQADPVRTTLAFAAQAQRHGAAYWTRTEVTSLGLRGDCVRGVATTRGEVEAGIVVVAAGAWSASLVRAVGVRLPVRTMAYQMIRSTPDAERCLGPVISSLDRELSLKQLDDGAYLLGGGWPGDVAADGDGYALRQESIDGNWALASELLPRLAEAGIAAAWCGLEAQSIDALPFIGPVPGTSGLFAAVGFSGHGFALAPAIGRAVAAALAGEPTPELEGLGLARVASLDAAEVAAFVGV